MSVESLRPVLLWMQYSFKWYRSKDKCIMWCWYLRYLHKTNTIVFTIISAIKEAKLHVSSKNISRVSLFGYVIYYSIHAHCKHQNLLEALKIVVITTIFHHVVHKTVYSLIFCWMLKTKIHKSNDLFILCCWQVSFLISSLRCLSSGCLLSVSEVFSELDFLLWFQIWLT